MNDDPVQMSVDSTLIVRLFICDQTVRIKHALHVGVIIQLISW